jgi:hypothetical protein
MTGSYSVIADIESCRVREGSTIFVDRLTCPAATPPATASSGFEDSVDFAPTKLESSIAFTGSKDFDAQGRGNDPESKPSYLWIGIGAGGGLLLIAIIAGSVAYCRRGEFYTVISEESDGVPAPIEASAYEISAMPVDECIESFNPVASSGDGDDAIEGQFVSELDEGLLKG